RLRGVLIQLLVTEGVGQAVLIVEPLPERQTLGFRGEPKFGKHDLAWLGQQRLRFALVRVVERFGTWQPDYELVFVDNLRVGSACERDRSGDNRSAHANRIRKLGLRHSRAYPISSDFRPICPTNRPNGDQPLMSARLWPRSVSTPPASEPMREAAGGRGSGVAVERQLHGHLPLCMVTIGQLTGLHRTDRRASPGKPKTGPPARNPSPGKTTSQGWGSSACG